MASSANELSHSRPYYEGDVDFDKLAEQDADFAAICKVSKDRRWIDFQDPQVVQQLTKSLLKADFKLSLRLPPDRLCPPVPVRWNYVRWIQELIDTTSPTYGESYSPSRSVTGLDIGVGASCIYSLLACSTRPKWRMLGTDIDQHSFGYARRNVEANELESRIKLALSTADSPLIPLQAMGIHDLDFVMCNPPFYASREDMLASYGGKEAPPSAVCTGADNEMICPGGDVAFALRILTESLQLRTRVQWYTVMLGKLPSLHQVVAMLKQNGISNFAVTSLQAGYKTKRWAVGWSFGDYRPRNDVARHGELVSAVLPQPTAQTIAVPLMDAKYAGQKVDAVVRELGVKWQWRESLKMGIMVAKQNEWSRAARRRKKFGEVEMEGGGARKAPSGDDSVSDDSAEIEEPVALAVKILCKDEEVEVRWLRGVDFVLFTSFSGMLKRALTGRA